MKATLHALTLALLAVGLTGLAQNSSPPQDRRPPPADTAPVPAPNLPDEAAPAPASDIAVPFPFAVQPLPASLPLPEFPAATVASAAVPGVPPSTTPAAPQGALPVRAAETENAAGAAKDKETEPVAEGETPTGDVVPLIVIDDVPLTDAIRSLARQSDINFMFDPQITSTNQPNISIRFENVTPQDALAAVLDNYNLSLTKPSKSKIARIVVKDPTAEDPLVSRIIQLKYCDPTNLVEVVKPTLSTRSRVLADARTRQLIVSTTEKEVEGLMQLIDKLDSRTKQVLIEARIFETVRSPQSIKGINWEGTVGAQNVTFGNNAVGGVVNGPPRLLANVGSGLTPATAFLNADGLSAVVSFLNKDSDTELVSTPRTVTLDNCPAELSVTRAFPVFQVTPGSANSPAGSTITYTNMGTILKVTPRIAADNNVSLTVIPEVSNIDGKDEQTINGLKNVANIYSFRRIETRVMIPSGFTLAMGGLIDDRSTKLYTKVPILGDVPVLGFLFRSSDKSREKKNLMVFVTPTIVGENDFHVTSTGTEFLQTEFVAKPDVEPSAWDSAHPHDWTKPVE